MLKRSAYILVLLYGVFTLIFEGFLKTWICKGKLNQQTISNALKQLG